MYEIEAKVKRLAKQVKKLKKSDRMKRRQIHQLQKQLNKMENACTCKKQKQENDITLGTQAQANPITVMEHVPLLSAFEDLHDEVLRENLPRMVDDMEIQRTDLLNELIEDDVISSDEGSTIRKSGNRHAQTRTLKSDRMKRRQIYQLQKQLNKMENACTCKEQEQENDITLGTQAQANPITVTEHAPLLSAFEDLHDEVLRENLPRMVDDMEIQRTDLLNELIEDDVISSDEGSTIRKSGNRHAQTRTLASIISRRSSNKFELFLKRLGERNNYPPVAKTIMDSYNRKKDKYWESRSKLGSCFPCSVIKKVNLDDVVDMLLQHGVVVWDFIDEIRESKNPSSLWLHVFKRIDDAINRLELINCLRMALNRKHPEIAEMLNGDNPHCFICYCKLQSSAARFVSKSVNCPDYCSSLGYVVTSSEDRESIFSFETMSNEFITPPAKKTRKVISGDVTTTSKSSTEIKSLESLHSVKQSYDKVEDWLSNYKYGRPIQENRPFGFFGSMKKLIYPKSYLSDFEWVKQINEIQYRHLKWGNTFHISLDLPTNSR